MKCLNGKTFRNYWWMGGNQDAQRECNVLCILTSKPNHFWGLNKLSSLFPSQTRKKKKKCKIKEKTQIKIDEQIGVNQYFSATFKWWLTHKCL